VQDDEFWAAQFEEQRPRLQAVAYRMLGSFADPQPPGLPAAWLAGG
jgi:RNA polymerase sigma-70 factor (ECF subfamily)